MLSFPRYEGQSIRLFTSDGEIRVKIGFVGSSRVELAIDAPRRVTVLRGEVPADPDAILSRMAASPR